MSDYQTVPRWVHREPVVGPYQAEPRRQAEPKRDVFLTYVIIVKTNLEVHILNTFRYLINQVAQR